jgi:UDP-glucose 4-epimerase
MKKVLVTGGAGFIGSNLVDKLIHNNHQVTVIDNESSDSADQFYYNDKAENLKLDVTNFEQIKQHFKDVDVVFHLAAEARIQPSIINPLRSIRANVMGTCSVLQAAREMGVKRVVYSSTSSGYGLNSIPNVEDQPDDCLNPYSVGKVTGEKLCKMYSDLFGLETIVFRYFNIYGNRQPIKGQYGTVIGIFERQKRANESLTVVGDGEQTRDFTNVDDVVHANILAATKEIDKKYFGTVFNIGRGQNYSINEIAKMYKHSTVNIPPRTGEARATLANIEKSKMVLGYNPKVNIEEWLNKRLK